MADILEFRILNNLIKFPLNRNGFKNIYNLSKKITKIYALKSLKFTKI